MRVTFVGLALLVCATGPAVAAGQNPANPYDAELRSLEAQMTHAAPPQMAVLLARTWRLREYVDSPAEVVALLQRIADDPQQNRLVRDEALRYLADADVESGKLHAAETKLAALGFVHEWQVAGPFPASRGLDARYGPEDGFRAGESFTDSAGRSHTWRPLPPAGPHAWSDLAYLYPHAGSSVIFAATGVYAEQPRTVALRFSAETAAELIVNGRSLLVARDTEGLGFDQHSIGVTLHAGWNSILLKLAYAGEPRWRFALRVADLNGGGITLPVNAQASAEAAAEVPVASPAADLLSMAQAAVDADPASASALETLGLIEREHAAGDALAHLQAAVRRAPTAERWLEVADTCPEATCVFDAATAALHLDTGNTRARVLLAGYYTGRNQLEKARDLLREAIRLAPGDFVAGNALAQLYLSVGLNREALAESERLEQDFPSVLWLKRKLAERYFDLGLLDRAQDLLQHVLRQDHDAPAERTLLVQLDRRRQDAAGLRAAYEEMARLDPADPAPLAGLAMLEAARQDSAAAERDMQAALLLGDGDARLRERFASLLDGAGKTSDARRELSRALEIDPQLEPARQRRELAGAKAPADNEAEYLEDAAVRAAAVLRHPPATTANAVMVSDVRVEEVADNGLSTVRRQQLFYLATEQAVRDYSSRSVQYSPAWQQLHVLHARVYKPDGRVLEAEEAGDAGVADTNISMYYDVRSRQVRFPALQRGDVIELDYRITPATHLNPYGDYFGGLVAFRSTLPEQLQRYVLITPARRKFNIVARRMPAAAVSEGDGKRIYRWELHNSAALPDEARGPSLTAIAPWVHISTFASWDELGRWYAQLIQPQLVLDPALREVAARLLKNTRDERERIAAIHQFVLRNTHYVALEFGIYSYKPYPVSQVYARRYGDCKDKASLMIALLRQAGIDADIALVRTRKLGEVDPETASIALFNHAVVYVPKYDLWLDGTAEYAGSRELPLDDQGASALVVSLDGHAALRRIPVTSPTDNYTRRTVRAQVMSDGRLQFSGVFYTRGEDAPGLRRDYETPERQRDMLRNTLAQVFPSVRVDEVQVNGAHDLEHPVTVEFRGTLDTFAGHSSMPLASSWMPRTYVQNLAQLEERTEDLLLPAPWTTEEELHFELPPGAVVTSMPADTVLDTPFGSASLRYQRLGREVVVRTSVQFRQLRIRPAEYAAFRDFCQQVEQAFHNEVKLSVR